MPERIAGVQRISRRCQIGSAGFFVAALLLCLTAGAHDIAAQAIAPTGAVAKDHLEGCLGCHGSAGLAANPAVPDLANQSQAYLYKQIVDFRRGARAALLGEGERLNLTGLRAHPAMDAFAGLITQGETDVLVRALSAGRACRQPPLPPGVSTNRPIAKPQLAHRCIACHGEAGMRTVNPAVPRLAGQSRTYIANQMFAMRRAELGQDGASALTLRSHPIMNSIAAGLTNADIRAVADYLSTLPCE